MEWLPARKTRPALNVEPLEDRRLLSHFAMAPAWENFARPVDTQAETSPMFAGSVDPRGDRSDGPGLDQNQGSRFDSTVIAPQESTGQAGSPLTVCATSPVLESSATGETAASISSPANLGSESNPNPGGDDPRMTPSSGVELLASAPPAVGSVALPPRAVPAFTVARSSPELVQTSSRVELTPPTPTPAPGRSASVAGETLLAVASSIASPPEVATSPDQSRGLVAFSLPIGPGLFAGQVAPQMMPTPSTGFSEPSQPHQVPIGQPGEADVSSSFEPPAVGRSGEPLEIVVSEPAVAEMIQSFLPFDRSTLETAIDHFLEPFDSLASTMPELRGPMGLITASLAAAATVVAVEVAIRLRRAREQDLGSDDVESLASFPGI
jgi:hypothetical protein